MRKILLVLLTFFAFSCGAKGLMGLWTTIDDKTGAPRAVVKLAFNQNGQLTGRILEVFKQKGDKGMCQNCSGRFKDKPVKGLNFLWGLKKKKEGVYGSGRILDPKTGRIYRAKVTLKDDAHLLVRGYIGIPLLGRTQIWIKQTT